MEYRYLGKTGLKVSALCLGTMTFAREADEATSHAILDRFVAAGGNFIDTANVYGRGASEEVVGRWLQGKARDAYVVATKVRFPMGDGPNEVGLGRKQIRTAVTASLQRLKTDYIDLYQTHCWDPVTPLEETLSTLNDLVREGLVRYIGASNHTGWQLQRAIDTSRRNGWEPYTCLQPQYSLLCRQTEWELLPLCRDEGIGVIPWSPLRGGWLTGKYHRGMAEPPIGTRVGDQEDGTSWKANNNDYTFAVIDALLAVAKEVGRSPSQVGLRWVLEGSAITAPIIGVRTIEQLNDNLGAVEFALTAVQRQRLDEASALVLPYPYDFIASMAQRDFDLDLTAR
ncbi:MAG: Putative oxidoreductase [uncultured Thermomicrobiales bacterium]|uniref:Oxidoreductase n=1 Tax=uncultured Thermomicrobiales bacterium TaxID=1645740 RepID=A0A6J4V2B5_9BACT|nr:MAG: Putative oxidoreductase [uncultured Thermomicrobiales bacterium]